MRYIFVSDVHGCYDKLISSLNQVNFNSDADTIVSVGDPFDRGPQSREVLEFLMSCPNRILIWGNHDLRLRQLILGGAFPQSYDKSNGVLETLQSFCGDNYRIKEMSIGVQILKSNDDCRDVYKLLWQYFDECVYAAEWPDLVATHAWIPVLVDNKRTIMDKWGFPISQYIYHYWDQWRNATAYEWDDASWCNSQVMFTQRIFIPNKTLLIGHWHSWRFREMERRIPYSDNEIIDCSTYFYKDKLIAIDGCSNYDNGGCVNAYVYESDEAPQFIRP